MDDLPEEVRERLRRRAADLALGEVRAVEMVQLAVDLLVDGVETPALLELAGEPPVRVTLADAQPLFERMLTELGVDLLDVDLAPWAVARDVARRTVDGTLSAEGGATELWRLREACDGAPEIAALIGPMSAWWDTPWPEIDVEARRAEIRELARRFVHRADARLAGR